MIFFSTKSERSSFSKKKKKKKIRGNMFSIYLVKMVFLFPTNEILPFCQKNVPLKKMIFILKNIVFLLTDGKDVKKVYSVKYA